jgi:glyoxylase-like metal-dependent hydrolase (beta-lactamase superfamily II)
MQDIPTHAFLIDHPDGYILFDTACDPDWKKNWTEFMQKVSPYTASEEQLLPNRLKQLGISPEDVGTVVMSHLHVDHAGCLYMFKKATIYVDDAEFTSVVRQYSLREPTFAHMRSDIEKALKAELHWRPVMGDEDILEIAKGVKIIRAGSGHSFGMLAMDVSLDSGKRFLMVADAIYMPSNITPEITVPGNVYDTLGYKRTVRYLLKYAKETKSQILYGHDMEQFKTLVKSNEGYYE